MCLGSGTELRWGVKNTSQVENFPHAAAVVSCFLSACSCCHPLILISHSILVAVVAPVVHVIVVIVVVIVVLLVANKLIIQLLAFVILHQYGYSIFE